MNRMRPMMVLMFSVLLLGGCATVKNGPMQRVRVDSEPAGATVKLEDCGLISTRTARTPATVWVSRRAEACRLTFDLDDHAPREFTLRRRVAPELRENLHAVRSVCDDDIRDCDSAGEVLGKLFFGGLVAGTGAAVDATSGAMFYLSPPRIFVDFIDRHPDGETDGEVVDEGRADSAVSL